MREVDGGLHPRQRRAQLAGDGRAAGDRGHQLFELRRHLVEVAAQLADFVAAIGHTGADAKVETTRGQRLESVAQPGSAGSGDARAALTSTLAKNAATSTVTGASGRFSVPWLRAPRSLTGRKIRIALPRSARRTPFVSSSPTISRACASISGETARRCQVLAALIDHQRRAVIVRRPAFEQLLDLRLAGGFDARRDNPVAKPERGSSATDEASSKRDWL